jgi:outer membrane biosynthesis protein TonB
MRYALYRLTAPILDRIPDISHQPKGRQISIGFAASVLFHLLLLLLAVVIGFVLPAESPLRFLAAKPKLEEIELTIVPPAPAEMRSVPLEEPPFLDSSGLHPADKPPEDAVFQSGRDMKAASEVAPKGDLPLPSQEGRVAPRTPEFEQQKLGREAPPKPAVAPAPPAAVPKPAEPQPAEAAKAPPTPDPVKKEMPGGEKPVTLKQTDKPAEDEIAVELKPKTAPPPPKLQMRNSTKLAMLAPPPAEPARQVEPGSDIQAEKTRVEGNISNRGPAAADAKATPLGRYNEKVARLIKSRWDIYMKDKGDIVALGSVRVRFSIDRKGRVKGVHSEDNTSNAAFAAICEKTVLESEFQPPGKDLSDALADGKLDITFTFTLY